MPASLADWVAFFRWLVSLWRWSAAAITAQQSITIAPKPAGTSDQETLGAAQAFAGGHVPAILPRDPDAAAIAAYGRIHPTAPTDELTGLAAQTKPAARQPADELTGLVQYLMARPPYASVSRAASVIRDTHAHRAVYAAAAYDGWFYWETSQSLPDTDRTVLYLSVGNAWEYVGGIMQATQATLPADLGAGDAGFLADVTDYAHRLQWSGSGWGFAPGDEGSGRVEGFLVDPNPTTGWHLCDGAAGVTYLKSDGTTGTVNLPDLVSTAAQAAYLKFGSPASSTVNPAVAPAFTGGSYTPAGAVSQPTFTGAALPAHAHATPLMENGANPYLTQNFGTRAVNCTLNFYLPHTATTSAGAWPLMLTEALSAGTPSGVVSQPAFTGTPAAPTGTVSATGEPQNVVLRPWFRC